MANRYGAWWFLPWVPSCIASSIRIRWIILRRGDISPSAKMYEDWWIYAESGLLQCNSLNISIYVAVRKQFVDCCCCFSLILGVRAVLRRIRNGLHDPCKLAPKQLEMCGHSDWPESFPMMNEALSRSTKHKCRRTKYLLRIFSNFHMNIE